MSEHQNIEYKRIWQDSYLKWISGFANANGGTLFIGRSWDAVIHRSYLSNSSIQIKITNDTLEIMNENSPFNEIKVEELKANHLSKPVNLLLADTFYKAGLIESWGRGTIKIIEECKRQGLSEPEYSLNENHFSVLFHRPIEDVVEDVTKDVTKDVTENRIQQLLELIKDNDRISTYKLAQVIGVSRMTIMRDIEYLKGKGVLERIGPSQGGYWKIIK